MKVCKKVSVIIFAILLLMSTSASAFGATSADVFSGGFLSVGSLKYAMENLGATNSEATTAIAQWNGVSSKVSISHSNISNPHIKLSLGRLAPPSPGALGLTVLTNSGLEVPTTQRWTQALCIRYNSSYLDTSAKKNCGINGEHKVSNC